MQENTRGRPVDVRNDGQADASAAPDVNPDAAEFQDGKRLAGSSSVSAKDALLGGAPGPLLGDDADTVNFPDNDPTIAATDNPDPGGLNNGPATAPEDADQETDDWDPDAPFADIGGAGGGPGAGPGPA